MTNDVAPTMDDMVRNILNMFTAASDVEVFEGTHWYDTARVFASHLGSKYGVSTNVAACVIAAHSMNARWHENMVRAESQLAGNARGLPVAIAMAKHAIDIGYIAQQLGDERLSPFDAITGPKLNPFARNVAGDLRAVATDRWAQRAAFDTLDDKRMSRWINRKGVRDQMIRAYTIAADSVGIEPAVMQAIVWVVVRGSAE